MKETIIRFNGLGYQNYYQSHVSIYDNSNRKIYSGQTYNGMLKICLDNKLYRIVARIPNDEIITYIYGNGKYCFSFKHSIIGNLVTFILKDYHYNLPIERGKIILWQKQ